MATTQKHKVIITHDQTTHTSIVSLDGRDIPGVRRADVHLRAHDCEIVLVMGDDVDVVIEADTQQIETRKESEQPSAPEVKSDGSPERK